MFLNKKSRSDVSADAAVWWCGSGVYSLLSIRCLFVIIIRRCSTNLPFYRMKLMINHLFNISQLQIHRCSNFVRIKYTLTDWFIYTACFCKAGRVSANRYLHRSLKSRKSIRSSLQECLNELHR